MKNIRITVVVVILLVVTMAGCYERRSRRRTTPSTPSTTVTPNFNEVNVVKFNRNKWKDEESEEDVEEEEEDTSVNAPTENVSFGNEENMMNNLFDELFGEDLESEKDTEEEGLNSRNDFHSSLFPNSLFLNNNFNVIPSASSLGPNICHQRKVERNRNTNNHLGFVSTSCSFINGNFQCSQSSNRNGLARRVVNTWNCCEGFSKDPTMKGCPIVEKQSNLECLQSSNMTELLSAFSTFELNKYLTEETEYTILAPDKKALNEFKKALDQHTGNVLEITAEMVEAADHIKDRLLSHILPDVLTITNFNGAKKVPTVLDNSHLFLFRHSLGRAQLSDLDVSVNCKQLDPLYTNSKNGRVYTLRGFLHPLKKSFKEIVEDNSNANKFLETIKSLDVSEVSEAGRTILVPTDKAFEGLSEWAQERIKNNPSELLKSLSMQYPLCPHQFDHVTDVRSIGGNSINVSKDNDTVKFDGAVLEGSESISTEGTIVYFVESFPNAEKLVSPSELANNLGASKFAELMKSSNFEEVRDAKFSIVVPSDAALEELVGSENEEQLLHNHTMVSPITESGFLETDDEDTKVYFKRFLLRGQMKKLIQCVPMKEHSTAMGYTVFTTNKILPKTEGTLLEMIEKDENLSSFYELIKFSGLESVLESMEHRFTLLVVENKVFSEMSAATVRTLKSSRARARSILLNHLLMTDFCTNDSSDEFVATLPTSRRRYVKWESKGGEVKVEGKMLEREKSDRMASNGVLHVVDGLINQPYTQSFFFSFNDF